jgi:hypothetical protein
VNPSLWVSYESLTTDDRTAIRNALADGHCVTASSEDVDIETNDMIITDHSYTVLAVEPRFNGVWLDYVVTLRNPWGYDGGTASGDANDGIVTLWWSDFASSFQGYEIN